MYLQHLMVVQVLVLSTLTTSARADGKGRQKVNIVLKQLGKYCMALAEQHFLFDCKVSF